MVAATSAVLDTTCQGIRRTAALLSHLLHLKGGYSTIITVNTQQWIDYVLSWNFYNCSKRKSSMVCKRKIGKLHLIAWVALFTFSIQSDSCVLFNRSVSTLLNFPFSLRRVSFSPQICWYPILGSPVQTPLGPPTFRNYFSEYFMLQ